MTQLILNVNNTYQRFRRLLPKVDIGLLVAMAFVLPLHKRAALLIVWLMILSWLLQGDFVLKFRRSVQKGGAIVFVTFFGLMLLYVLGGLYSSDHSSVLFELEKKSALVLFPLLLFSMNDRCLNKRTLDWIFTGFVVGLVCGYIYCMGNGWSNYDETGNISYLYYERFSVLHHPGYYSLYTCFAIAILIFRNIAVSQRATRVTVISRWLLVIFFVVMLFFVASKAGIISLIILGLLSFLHYIFVRKLYLDSIVFFLATILLIGAGFTFMQGFKTRFQAMEKMAALMETSDGKQVANGIQIRRLVWEISYQQILHNPLLGTGTGDYEARTREEIDKRALMEAFGGYKNAHNQFLQTTVTIGIGGLLMLLLWLFYPMVLAFRRGNFLYVAFIILIATNFLIESMLETQSGVLFVSFFHSLLFVVMMAPHDQPPIFVDPDK